MKSIVVRADDHKNAKSPWLEGTALYDAVETLTDILVPQEGKAPTRAGETLRVAVNSVYNFLNDGKLTSTFRNDNLQRMSEDEQTQYLWAFLYAKISIVLKSKDVKDILTREGISIQVY